MFPAGADGGAAMDAPQGAGGSAGDCGNDFCAGREAGTNHRAGDERGSFIFAVEGRKGAGGDSGQTDGRLPLFVGLFRGGGGDGERGDSRGRYDSGGERTVERIGGGVGEVQGYD